MQSMFKCPCCNGEMEIIADGLGQCIYCESKHPLPKSYENQLNRANKLRQEEMRFDEALELYKEIVSEAPDELEAHWGAVLCRFGIEYVEDAPKKFKPTCHRTIETSIFEDVDYRMIMERAGEQQKELYSRQAGQIDAIQKKILAFQATAEPYDIFLSLKVTDDSGNKTVEREIAMRLYDQLSDKYRVFFSEVSLKSEYAGEDYEAVIYSALRSSKVMILIAENVGNMKAKWVRNEWSRYNRMGKEDKEKKLICLVRKEMLDDDGFPIEFAAKEHLFIGDIGYETDLLHNLDTYFKRIRKKSDSGAGAAKGLSGERDMKLVLAENAFRQKDYQRAKEAAHEATLRDSECAKAYWYRLLASIGYGPDNVLSAKVDFSSYKDFEICCRYAEGKEREEYIRISEECLKNLKLQESYDQDYQKILSEISGHGKEMDALTKRIVRGNKMNEDGAVKLDFDFFWGLVGMIATVVFWGLAIVRGPFELENKNLSLFICMGLILLSSASLIAVIEIILPLWAWDDVIKYSLIVAIVRIVIYISYIYNFAQRGLETPPLVLGLEALIALFLLIFTIRGFFWIFCGQKGKKLKTKGVREYNALRDKLLQESQERLLDLNKQYGKRAQEIEGSVSFSSAQDLENWFAVKFASAQNMEDLFAVKNR